MPQDESVFPQQQPTSSNGEVNEILFTIKQQLALVNVATQVQVVAVHTTGNTAAVGTVDVKPLVNAIDGGGRAWPHDVIYGIPYIRIQGGVNAIICDPHIGDQGLCVFCDRDQSAVANTGNQSNPGSARRFDMADGIYIGGWDFKTAPQNYVVINPDGSIAILSTGRIDVTGTVAEFHCPVIIDQTLEVKGATTLDATLEVKGNATLDQNLIVVANFTFGGSFTGTGAQGSGNATLHGSLTATSTVTASDLITSSLTSINSHTHTDPQGGNTGGPTG